MTHASQALNKMPESILRCGTMTLTFSISNGAVAFFENKVSQDLQELWKELLEIRTNFDAREDKAHWYHQSNEMFLLKKKNIRQYWNMLTITKGIVASSGGIKNLNNMPRLQEMCYQSYLHHMEDVMGSRIRYKWRKIIQTYLETDVQEREKLYELCQDDFLPELWEEYGMDKLEKERFSPKPKPAQVAQEAQEKS